MSPKSFLGEFEHMVLLAIMQLRDGAVPPRIAEELESRAGRVPSRGALYTTLERLEQKGLVRWEIEAATSERGGNRSRRFEVTAAGIDALIESREALMNLWHGLGARLRRG
jgi:DNA-binding PadR family transcriptional regulator